MQTTDEVIEPKGINEIKTQLAYTVYEAAERLNMSVKSVRRQLARGTLRRCNKFGRILIPRRDVDNYFDSFSE